MSIYLHVYMHTTTCTLGAHRCQKNIRATETAITDGWEPPCHCWEPNLRPLEELQVLLITNQPASLSSDLFLFCFVWFGFGFGVGSTVLFYFETEPCCAVLLAYKELRLQADPYFVYSFVFQKLSGHCLLELALDFTSSSVMLWETLGMWGSGGLWHFYNWM